MTSWREFFARPLVLAVAAGSVALASLVWWAIAVHQGAVAGLERVEPRQARLVGLEASAAELDRALAGRRTLLDRYAYPASFDTARAGSDAQQRARDLFTRAGLQVASTQVLPAKPLDGFERIPLVLRMDGDFSALHGALVVLGSQSPALTMEALSAQTVLTGKPDAPARVSVQATLYVLRVRP